MTPATPHSHNIPVRLLILFNAAMLMSIFLLMGTIPLWVTALFAVATVTRTVRGYYRQGTPPLLVKLAILGGGIGGVYVEFGSITGIEAGLSVLTILVSLKFLEARAMRDIRVLALLGYFVLLCGLFFAQDLARWLYVGGTLILLTIGVAYSHIADSEQPLRVSTLTSLKLFAQAIPLIILLFIFFPRIYSGFRFQFGRSVKPGTGMSDEMKPGSFASLALRHELAFRADFPDGNPPPQSELYWRGVVLWRGDGLTWNKAGSNLSTEPRRNTLAGAQVRQRIWLQPHGGRWIFALDRPLATPGRFEMRPGGFLESPRPVYYPQSYEVVSRPESRETRLPRDQRELALALPANLSRPVSELATRLREGAANERAIIQAALKYFRNNGFTYTLTPGEYGTNSLEEFLFQRRSGFCEHYAGAFATLMRAAGVPSRVVIGYHGGQSNRGQYVIVRQSDAHAWCEVWIAEKGWQRVDPTSVIAPERIAAGLDTYLENQASGEGGTDGQTSAASGWRQLVRDGRLLWDSLAYRWDLLVLNFDEEGQRSFLLNLGLGAWDWGSLIALLGGAITFVIVAIALWLRLSGRVRQDPIRLWYDRFCQTLARNGVARDPSEGPLAYYRRASAKLPAKAEQIERAGRLYVSMRYSADPASLVEFSSAVRELQKASPVSSESSASP
jgi:transglutaminase-like putative cysteine protease